MPRTAKVSVVSLVVVVGAIALALVGDRLDIADGPAARASRESPSPPPAHAGTEGPLPHLRALARIATEHGGNRAAGTAGAAASVRYVEERLRAAGWRVRRQPVRFPYFREVTPPRLRVGDRAVRGRRDVRPLEYSGSGVTSGRLRPIGEGCDRASVARAVRQGDIALAQRGTCTFAVKARNTAAGGAGALLIANTGPSAGAGTFSGSLGAPGQRLPVLAVSPAAVAGLDPGAEARLVIRTVSETRTTHNVIAETPSAGAGRVAMAGAHVDSVPAGPGINDNASGVAALLDVAERLPIEPGGPRVRLGFWGAEELGLIGSRRYVAVLSRSERSRISAYVNLDMVGSPRPQPAVYAGGTDATARRVERRLRSALRRRGVKAATETPGASSDHASFAPTGIPVGGLFTGADPRSDPCYHRRCDDLDNVDERMAATMAAATREVLAALGEPRRG